MVIFGLSMGGVSAQAFAIKRLNLFGWLVICAKAADSNWSIRSMSAPRLHTKGIDVLVGETLARWSTENGNVQIHKLARARFISVNPEVYATS